MSNEFIIPTKVKRIDSVIPESVNTPIQELYEDLLTIKSQVTTTINSILEGGGALQS